MLVDVVKHIVLVTRIQTVSKLALQQSPLPTHGRKGRGDGRLTCEKSQTKTPTSPV